VGAAIGLQGPAVGRGWWDLTFRSELPYYYIFLAVLAVVLYTTFEVERSRFGYYLRAIKAGERAARSLGVPVRETKLKALMLSALFTSVAGSLYSIKTGFIDPESGFGILVSVQMVIVAALGGAGALFGPLIGALILVPLQTATNTWFGGGGSGLTYILYGGIIVLLARFEPGGMHEWWQRVAPFLARRKHAAYGAKRLQGIRQCPGGAGRRSRRRRRRDHRADRPQRRRQVHLLQLPCRRYGADDGPRAVRRRRCDALVRRGARARGHRPHVPSAGDVRRYDGARQCDGRRVSPPSSPRRRPRVCAAHHRNDRLGAPERPTRPFARHARTQAARDCPRACDRPAADAARRGARGPYPRRVAAGDPARAPNSRIGDHARDRRAYHGSDHDARPARVGVQPGSRDRPRPAARNRRERGGDRGLSGPRPPPAERSAVNELRVSHLKVHYGDLIGVADVSLRVEEGAIVALLGWNGSGKTTTLNAIAGLVQPSGGSIEWCGEKIARQPAYVIVAKGLALSPEGWRLFVTQTVEQNLRLGAAVLADKARIAALFERVYALFPRLAERRHQLAGTLSGGERQMLALGRALMSEPRLLMLDE